ncbi:hypothetical protein Ahy_B03g061882 [Arachis hypogaea]|uniref:Uncharacterized protein n=1 Tax=Arachis hypogaea TaxID=3818 RepID=A0A444ZSA9_ARAHY|nr:hypothetical protein Ahy_B03g061882 [Arachis hypogaea]
MVDNKLLNAKEGGPSEKDNPFDLCPIIPVLKEEFNKWCKPRKTVFTIKILRKRVYQVSWSSVSIEIRLKKDYSNTLLERLWMIARYYLIVQRWRPFFLTSKSVVRKISAWIRIPIFSIEIYNHHFLWRVGSTIGNMLKIDKATSV